MGRSACLALLLTPLLTAVACEEKNAYVPPPPPKVVVAKPEHKSVTDYLDFTGTTAATDTVQLRARVQGYLEKVLFKDGQQVKKGDLLFVIEQPPYQASVDQAKADVAKAAAALKQAQVTVDRLQQAGRTGAVSKQQIDEAIARSQVEAAQVLAQKAALETADLNLGYTEVRAPFDGRLGRRLVDPGNLVGAGQDTVIVEINRIQPIYVYFTINERDLLRIMAERETSPGDPNRPPRKQPLSLGLANEEGYPHEGELDFAAITLDPGTGTLQLRGIFPNTDFQILPGLFARIQAPIGEMNNALVVPQDAVGYDQLGAYVLTVDDKNIVQRTGVKTGPLSGSMRVIVEGLKGDESVVVKGLLRAIPGREVTPEQKQAATVPAKAAGAAISG